MFVIDPEDLQYVEEVGKAISQPLEQLQVICFWLTMENDLIGTSLTYEVHKESARYWVPADTLIPELCVDRRDLLTKIWPRCGLYITYMKDERKWRLVSEGKYDNTNVLMRVGDRIIPARLKETMIHLDDQAHEV